MPDAPTTIGELFRSLGLTLTVRAAAAADEDEEPAWACALARSDGRTYEIDSVAFFDVDPDTGEEWEVEPSPSRVLSVLAGGDVEDEEDGDDAGEDAEASARAFLGDDAYDLLLALEAAGAE
jgi:hypothetical protein